MQIVIYSKENCQFCDKAKHFLHQKDLLFREKKLDIGQKKNPHLEYYTREELLEKLPGARSVPQIFIDGSHIGGYTELVSFFKK